jgi:hypothetical protein
MKDRKMEHERNLEEEKNARKREVYLNTKSMKLTKTHSKGQLHLNKKSISERELNTPSPVKRAAYSTVSNTARTKTSRSPYGTHKTETVVQNNDPGMSNYVLQQMQRSNN